jgi:hypothetical protein
MSWVASVVRAATSWLTTHESSEDANDSVEMQLDNADEAGGETSPRLAKVSSTASLPAEWPAGVPVEQVDDGSDESPSRPMNFSSPLVSSQKPAEFKRETRKRSIEVVYRDATSSDDEQSRDSNDDSSYEHSHQSEDSDDSSSVGQSINQVSDERETKLNSKLQVAGVGENEKIRLYPLQREIDAARYVFAWVICAHVNRSSFRALECQYRIGPPETGDMVPISSRE